MDTIVKAKRAYHRTASFAAASAITGVSRKTLWTWAMRYGWSIQAKP